MGDLSQHPSPGAPAASLPAADPLPEGYYADNFAAVLDTVHGRYEDLLADDEIAFRRHWHDLTLPARRLYVRLISRKGPVFRRDRLRYDEIGELDGPVAELEASGLADDGGDLAPIEVLPVLLREEILELAAELDGPRPSSTRKGDLLADLAERWATDDGATRRWRRALADRWRLVRPIGEEIVAVYRLLFFGNLSQDWTEFVLRDLGVVRYEAYELKQDLRLFPTRQALDDTLSLIVRRRRVEAAVHDGELDEALEMAREVLAGAWHPSTRRHRDRLFNRVGRELERRGETATALELYTAAEAPPSRERRARILAELGRDDEALALCAEIAADPLDEEETVFAPRFAHRLRRRRGETVRPWRRPARPRFEMAVEKHEGRPVETLVLDALADGGRRGFFAENWLWRSLFGLAFWDIVFAPVEGAFQHPFQLGPLDLATAEFRRRRAAAVEARLAELRATRHLGPRLAAVYEAKRDLANRLVVWSPELRPALELAWDRLDGRHLAWVADRLSRDPRRYRRGLPDLFVLRDEEPGFELLEVKGPGDQLRPEQGAWIDYLNAGGLPTSIVHVRWLGTGA